MHFRGHSTSISPGVLTARATCPSAALLTRIDADGVHGAVEPLPGDEAHLECRLTLRDGGLYDEVGTISFGNGNALRFRTTGVGTIEQSPDPALRHGSASWEIDGGSGVFDAARGRIVSNLLVSESGEITDHQLGVVFLPETVARPISTTPEGDVT